MEGEGQQRVRGRCGGLNLGAIRQPDAKAITHRLLVVARVVSFEAVPGAAGIGDDHGRAGGN